jgi:hypothetical protein
LSRKCKGNTSPIQVQIIKTLSEDYPDDCTNTPSWLLGRLNEKSASWVLFSDKASVILKGTKQAEHNEHVIISQMCLPKEPEVAYKVPKL